MTNKINTLWVERLKSLPQWAPYFAFGLVKYDARLIGNDLEKRVRIRKELLSALNSFYPQFSSSFFVESCSFWGLLADKGLVVEDNVVARKLRETICVVESEIEIFENELKYFAKNNDLNKKKKRGPRFSLPQFFAFECLVVLRLNENDEDGLNYVKSFLGPNGELGSWILDKSKNKELKMAFVDGSGVQNIREWATLKKLTLERIILSRQLGYEVKRFIDIQTKVDSLRGEVNQVVEKLRDESSGFLDT